jgi:hypothetical protein
LGEQSYWEKNQHQEYGVYGFIKGHKQSIGRVRHPIGKRKKALNREFNANKLQ